MSDKMKKKTIIVLTKAVYLSCHPYLNSHMMRLLCACSDINVIISYTTVSRISEGNIGS